MTKNVQQLSTLQQLYLVDCLDDMQRILSLCLHGTDKKTSRTHDHLKQTVPQILFGNNSQTLRENLCFDEQKLPMTVLCARLPAALTPRVFGLSQKSVKQTSYICAQNVFSTCFQNLEIYFFSYSMNQHCLFLLSLSLNFHICKSPRSPKQRSNKAVMQYSLNLKLAAVEHALSTISLFLIHLWLGNLYL